MNANLRRSMRGQRIAEVSVLVFGSTLMAWPGIAAEATVEGKGGETPDLENAAAETPEDYRNWFSVSVGGYAVSGDRAQFQRRFGFPAGAFGGVEEFHYEQDVGKKGLLQIDGRGIFDNQDYSISLDLSHPDIGYLRAGFSEFRSWYDGSGGFFPQNAQWFSIYDDDFFLDRGEAWFEGGLTLPDRPHFFFKYAHIYRDGKKDSTIWGDSNLTGGFGTRGIVPSFYDISEERDLLELDMTHEIGNTGFGLGLRYELSDNDNTRNIRRRPGEPAADRYLSHREGVETDMFNAHAFTETWFTENILFTTGYSLTRLTTDLSGSRIYGADYEAVYDPLFARRQARDEGFLNLAGGAEMKQYVLNLNLMVTPFEHVTIVPSVRVEKQDQDGTSHFIETAVGAGAGLPTLEEEFLNKKTRDLLDVSESLEARYTGFTNWVLYARGEWLQGDGDLSETELDVPNGAIELFRDTDSTRFTQKYIAGANWYPLRRLSFSGQYYHKIRNNDYDHRRDSTPNDPASGNRFPAFLRNQDFKTDDVNFRVTFRPVNRVTLVSRYDFQLSTIDSRADFLSNVESAEMTSHIFSQSVSWTPIARLYLQGSASYALDRTETPSADALGAAKAVLDAKNNYWNGTASAGYALTEKTDLQAQYSYYRADNYEDNSQFGQPYGAGAEEHGITTGVVHRIRSNMIWSMKYGFFNYRDATSGRNNDFDAHLVYSNLQYRF